jgi:hypothetical protein
MNSPKTDNAANPPTNAIAHKGTRLLVSAINFVNVIKVKNKLKNITY